MIDFLQQYWLWILLGAGMLAMHLGGHSHGTHRGQRGMSGCGGHSEPPSGAHQGHDEHPSPQALDFSRLNAPAPIQDTRSPDGREARTEGSPPVDGVSSPGGQQHRHGC